MSSFLAFLHSGIEAYTGRALEDGKYIARLCVQQLERLKDLDQFPPRLLILLASPAYLELTKASHLLDGVNRTFAEAGYQDVPLIGCSTAAVFFDRRVHREGALLICLASRLLRAEVAVGTNVSLEPEASVIGLLDQLKLRVEKSEDVKPFADPSLFTFFPGFEGERYLAADVYERLRRNMPSGVPIFGGVASADDPQRRKLGILFSNKDIHNNAIVAARMMCGIPLSLSLNDGLTEAKRILRVSKLGPDKRTIHSFHEGAANEVMKQILETSPVALLTEITTDRDLMVDTPKPTDDRKAVQVMREISEHAALRVLHPVPEKIHANVIEGIQYSLKKSSSENPIACIAFKCTGLLRHRKKIGLNFEQEFASVESALDIHHLGETMDYVGGFVDGEASVDMTGRSRLGNWSTAAMVLGDEIQERTPVQRCFAKLANFAGEQLADDPNDSIEKLVQLIYDIGIPGAMISLRMNDQERETLVAQAASGSHYRKVKDLIHTRINSDDILAIVARERKTVFIPDSRIDRRCDQALIEKAGIVSQYIVPLITLNDQVTAVLQFDLADISYKKTLYPTQQQVLDSIATIISAILNHIFSREVSIITRKLDEALKVCLSAQTVNEGLQQYLEKALDAFNVKMGHIRLAQEWTHSLTLAAGIGSIYEAIITHRKETDVGDVSPTALAFRDDKLIVVNDAEHNSVHRRMCRHLQKEKALYDVLNAIGSYANVPFKAESGERGIVSLESNDSWVFPLFRERALKYLGDRFGFLLENLGRKQAERLFFGIRAKYSHAPNLDDVSKILAEMVERFAKTIRADVAALYLWDENQHQYILRAHRGWIDQGWTHASKYNKEDQWTGTIALAGTLRHIPDLYAYYQRQGQLELRERYEQQMFGEKLSESFTVEAIGLPLNIADRLLGVLTLYRPIKPGQPSGFLTTDKRLLQESADRISESISLLQFHCIESWERQEVKRRQEVYDATIIRSANEDFESRICLQVLKSYRANRVDFYRIEQAGATPKVTWRGSKLDSMTESIKSDIQLRSNILLPNQLKYLEPLTESAKSATSLPDDRIKSAPPYTDEILKESVKLYSASLSQGKPIKILVLREQIKNENRKIPRLAATEGLVTRVCLPLVSEKQLVGVLDIEWVVNYRQAYSPDHHHYERNLWVLGTVIGSAYRRYQSIAVKKDAESRQTLAGIERKEAERIKWEAEMERLEAIRIRDESEQRNQFAVQVTSAYILQNAHHLLNEVSDMRVIPRKLLKAETQEQREKALKELEEAIDGMMGTTDWILNMGNKIIHPTYEICNLKVLINQAVERLNRSKLNRLDICLFDEIPTDKVLVKVDQSLILMMLNNLLNNSINAMQGMEKPVLTISGSVIDDERIARVTIEDKGIGMSNEEIQNAMDGFNSIMGRRRLGVLISKIVLSVHSGQLNYDSEKGAGTKTIITLPLAPVE